MLIDAKIPIMSFGYYAMFAPPNSGKTYQMNNLCEVYIE